MGSITRSFANLITANGPSGIPDGTVTNADLTGNINFKNIIINGDMSIAQRGTTSSSTGYQTVDRWQLNTGTQQEQKTDTPNARFSNSFEVTGTTAGSSGYGICSQRIESKNILSVLGQTCTLSAYVKNTGTSTVNVSVEVYRANSTDDFSSLTLLTSLTGQAITASWNRITFPSFTVTDACATGLEVRIFRYDASNDQEWLLTGVQLEAGTSASDFEFLPYDVNLRRCQRYCQVLTEANTAPDFYVSLGDNVNGVAGRFFQVNFPTTMRTACSTSFTSASHFETLIYETGWTDCSTIAAAKGGTTSMVIETTGSNNDSRGLGTALRIENASGQITFSAEL